MAAETQTGTEAERARSSAPLAAESRLRSLVDAGIALSSELSLDGLLQRLVDTAATLTGARYAALGVIDRSGTMLERFLTTGIDEKTRRRIGDLPRGRGVLGVLIQDVRPLRLRNLSDDPSSVGFPPGHPPMRSFLGVPIVLRGVPYGDLYLAEKHAGEEFSEEDEELMRLLAAQAAVAVENARLYESSTRWLRQLAALNQVGDALTGELELPRLLELVATRLRELVDARLVLIELPSADGLSLTVAAASGEGAERLLGLRLDRQRSKGGRTLARRRSERVDSLIDDPEVDQSVLRLVEAIAALYIPLVVSEQALGVVTVYDKRVHDRRFSDVDLRAAETLAGRAASAVELSQRVAAETVRKVLEGQEGERRRLARELHDETGQALTSALLGLATVEAARNDEQALVQATAGLRELLRVALEDVRQLPFELRPQALDNFGLVAALERLTERLAEHSGLQVSFTASLDVRLGGELETCLYRTMQEALTNVVKHAQASRVSVTLTKSDQGLAALIEDDGRGFSPTRVAERTFGLIAMRERLELLGGTLEIDSGEGRGTRLRAELPAS